MWSGLNMQQGAYAGWGGKGKGSAKGKVEQPQAKPAEELVPLEPSQVEAIAVYLEQNGGALPLGRVCQNFRGLKRGHLESYFEMSQVGSHGQWEVRLPGMESQGAEMIYQGKALPLDAPLPPLTPEQISAITAALQKAHGNMPYVQLTKEVPGIKRQQLQEHFQVVQVDKKRFDISLNGPPGRIDTRQTKQQSGAAAGMAKGMMPPATPGELTPQAMMMQQDSQLMQQMAAGMTPRQQKRALEELLPPLDAQAINEVTKLLEANGGETWMGKVSQNFKHIKRSQLEGHFEFSKVGDQWLIRLPGIASSIPGGVETDTATVKQLLGTGNANANANANMAVQGPAMRATKMPRTVGAFGCQGNAMPGKGMQKGMMMGKGGCMARPSYGMNMNMGMGMNMNMNMNMGMGMGQGMGMKGKGKGKGKEKSQEPVEPLPPEVLAGIEALVLEGGENGVSMGRICQAFVGVKKAQLQEHFNMWREGDQWKVLPKVG